MSHRRWKWAAALGSGAAIGVAAVQGCVGDDPSFSPDAGADGASTVDGSVGVDAPGADAPADVDVTPDGGSSDAAADVVYTYADAGDPSRWSAFPIRQDGGIGVTVGYSGGVFDGRHVYLVPNYGNAGNCFAARYDTQGSFTSASAWEKMNTSTVNAGALGFIGGAYDGRYVYFTPSYAGSNNQPHGIALRYDPQGAFTAAGSWMAFDTTAVTTIARDYGGAIFDGRYIYFPPRSGNSYALRYDTQAAFNGSSSWKGFSLAVVSPNAYGFVGGVFDGRYVYFSPSAGIVTRYDTTQAFDLAAAWESFDQKAVNADAHGFQGAVFDGRYVYYVPNYASNWSGLILRFDTTASFSSAASYTAFDLSTVNGSAKGFSGATFDGRYVFFVPQFNGTSDSGLVARLDTAAGFTQAASWTFFDTSTINAGAVAFGGGVFDGRFLYFVPASTSAKAIPRFDDKSPKGLPLRSNASFY